MRLVVEIADHELTNLNDEKKFIYLPDWIFSLFNVELKKFKASATFGWLMREIRNLLFT